MSDLALSLVGWIVIAGVWATAWLMEVWMLRRRLDRLARTVARHKVAAAVMNMGCDEAEADGPTGESWGFAREVAGLYR